MVGSIEAPHAPGGATEEAITGYIRGVRAALQAGGITIDPTWQQGHGATPSARIYIGSGSREYALTWDAAAGWAVGRFINTYGGGRIEDRLWFGIGVAPDPSEVAGAVAVWRVRPDRYTDTAPVYDLQAPLGELLTDALIDRHAARVVRETAPYIDQWVDVFTRTGVDCVGGFLTAIDAGGLHIGDGYDGLTTVPIGIVERALPHLPRRNGGPSALVPDGGAARVASQVREGLAQLISNEQDGAQG
ncbi:DUF6292 family protein [Actinomadura sp. LOL_016]|uniref:DUF6292 family protein n=1 Tax=unclassified Actinomadura TaxID=2626254 RepID=UPI003A7F9DC4